MRRTFGQATLVGTLLLGSWLGSVRGTEPEYGADKAVGSPPKQIAYAPVPVVNYVAIRAVWKARQNPQDQPDQLVWPTASDTLHLAYTWASAIPAPSPLPTGPTTYDMWQWSNGKSSLLSKIPNSYAFTSADGKTYDRITYNIVGVNNNGTPYGSAYQEFSYYPFGAQWGMPSPLSLFKGRDGKGCADWWQHFGFENYPHSGIAAGADVYTKTAGKGGAFAGTAYSTQEGDLRSATWVGGGSMPYAQFNPRFADNYDSTYMPFAASEESTLFTAQIINRTGLAIGTSWAYQNPGTPIGATPISTWNGHEFKVSEDLRPDNCTLIDLNDQGKILVYNFNSTSNNSVKAGILDNSKLSLAGWTSFYDKLDPVYVHEVFLGQPVLIGNEYDQTNHSYKVLCSVYLSPPPPGASLPPGTIDSGYGIFDYDGTVDPTTHQPKGWSFARLQFPPNVLVNEVLAMTPDGALAVRGAADYTHCTSEEMVVLLPVELIDGNGSTVSELRVANMTSPGVLTGPIEPYTKDLFPAVINTNPDSERFYIRIKNGAQLGLPVKIVIDSHSNIDPSYDDPGNDMEMIASGNDLVSKSMLLASDYIDSVHIANELTNNTLNDPTHRLQLGGKFRIKSIKVGTKESVLNIDYTIAARKKLHFRITILRQTVGGTPTADPTTVAQDIKLARDRYVQAGIDVTASIRVVNPPPGVDLTDGLDVTIPFFEDQPNLPSFTESAEILMNTYGTPSTDDIDVFYVNYLQGSKKYLGATIVRHDQFKPGEFKYGNTSFIAAGRRPFTLAHELGHLMTQNGSHPDDIPFGAPKPPLDPKNQIRVMRKETSASDTVGGSKRFTNDEIAEMQDSVFVTD